MVNKNVLPLKFKIPICGETVFLTRGLKYNMEFLLFWGPWAPFDNSWHLRDDYKNANRRRELAKDLSKVIGYIGNTFFLAMHNVDISVKTIIIKDYVYLSFFFVFYE